MLANHKVRTWGPEVEAEGFNNDALIVIWQRDYRKADVYSRQLLQNSCLATHSNQTWVSVAEVVREREISDGKMALNGSKVVQR